MVVCDTAKVRFFKQITTKRFAPRLSPRCLRYCKSTIFQANHNIILALLHLCCVVCDTAKVRFFKQITTKSQVTAISAVVCDTAKVRFFKQITTDNGTSIEHTSCLRYCKSTIFQANHNYGRYFKKWCEVVCDTAKVRFFKQITTHLQRGGMD